MASRNYYSDERKLYSEAYGIKVENKKSLKILKKLCNHYEVPMPRVKFRGCGDGGSAGINNIRLSNNPSIGLIMHEFAHYAKYAISTKEHLTLENQGTSHHGTKFQSCLNFVNIYSRSKDYWRTMTMKSEVTVKAEEEKTEEEIVEEGVHIINRLVDEKKEEIKKAERKLENYKKRLQYFTKLYTTKIHKGNRSLAGHKRALDKILIKIINKSLTLESESVIVGGEIKTKEE